VEHPAKVMFEQVLIDFLHLCSPGLIQAQIDKVTCLTFLQYFSGQRAISCCPITTQEPLAQSELVTYF